MSRLMVLFALLFTSLFADDEQFPFLGVTISTQTVDLQPVTALESQQETTFGVRYGRQSKDIRTMLSFNGNSDFQDVAVEVDWLFTRSMFGMPEIRPYVGATLGYLHYDEALLTSYLENGILIDNGINSDETLVIDDINTIAAEDTNGTKTVSTSDGYYGLNFGFLFYITDNVDLDVSYHYYFVDRLEPLKTMQGGTLGLHYFY